LIFRAAELVAGRSIAPSIDAHPFGCFGLGFLFGSMLDASGCAPVRAHISTYALCQLTQNTIL
jgi:hypothetical protein